MTFEVHLSHEVIGGEKVIEQFGGVKRVLNPHAEVSDNTVLQFPDGTEKTVKHGQIIEVKKE